PLVSCFTPRAMARVYLTRLAAQPHVVYPQLGAATPLWRRPGKPAATFTLRRRRSIPMTTPRTFRTSWLWCALAACAPPASPQPRQEIVAYSGQPIDAQRVFHRFDSPVINQAGQILFWAWTAIDTPLNDECAGAIDVSPGLITVGNTEAT